MSKIPERIHEEENELNQISKEQMDGEFRKIRCDMIVRQCTQVFKYLDKS